MNQTNLNGITNISFSDPDDSLSTFDPALTAKYLENNYSFTKLKSDNVLKSTKNYMVKYYKPSPSCMMSFFLKRFPFFEWIRHYNFSEAFVKDLASGLTGMAYSLSAGLPAINGLYVTFFAVILYVIFGTSRHLSTGTYAITSLMVASSIQKFSGILFPAHDVSPTTTLTSVGSYYTTSFITISQPTIISSTPSAVTSSPFITSIYGITTNPISQQSQDSSSNFLSNDPSEAKVLIAMALCFTSGIIHVLLGLFHIGFVVKYLSDAIVNGFSTGVAIQVVVSQIPGLLGIRIPASTTPFFLIESVINIFKNILKTNMATVIISIIAMLVLNFFKFYLNEKLKNKLPVPIPIEFIVVVIGTLVSYLVDFNQKWNVNIVGNLPVGMPAPRAPAFQIIGQIIGDSVSIAIVSFAINISMAKIFARKYKYEIRPNQELFAYGTGNIAASFFSGFPSCVALSRCAILDSIGGKTQIYGLFASILVLIVILFLGPLFKTLPNACLAAIIVIALKNMVLQVHILPVLFRKSKLEALAWLATFMGIIIFNVDIGLYIGIGVSLLLVIFKSQRARTSVLGNIPDTNVFESIEICKEAKEFNNIKIIRYEESIYYANVENFKYKIIKLVGVNPEETISNINREFAVEYKKLTKTKDSSTKKCCFNTNKYKAESAAATLDLIIDNKVLQKELYDKFKFEVVDSLPIKHIIIDFSCVNYIDSQGVSSLLQLYESYKEVGVSFYLSYCKQNVIRTFRKQSVHEKFDFDFIFASTNDAISYIFKNKPLGIKAVAYDNVESKQNTSSSNDNSSNIEIDIYPDSVYKEQTVDDYYYYAEFDNNDDKYALTKV